MQETVALEQERSMLAERLLRDIERRHGLLHPASAEINPTIADRYLVAYLPETHEGAPVPQTVEFAFTPTLQEAVRMLGRVVEETDHGWGSACYVYDLNTGSALAESEEGR
jgi:hypothetical protein